MSRRTARKKAFQVLFGIEVGETDKDIMLSKILNNANISNLNKIFGRDLVEGVLEKKEELDELITYYSKFWDIKRIGKVELCILRIALYEILYEKDIPSAVSINEAVELAKNFASDNSGGFINGILDMINKEKIYQGQ